MTLLQLYNFFYMVFNFFPSFLSLFFLFSRSISSGTSHEKVFMARSVRRFLWLLLGGFISEFRVMKINHTKSDFNSILQFAVLQLI
jgi:hypothetical protein